MLSESSTSRWAYTASVCQLKQVKGNSRKHFAKPLEQVAAQNFKVQRVKPTSVGSGLRLSSLLLPSFLFILSTCLRVSETASDAAAAAQLPLNIFCPFGTTGKLRYQMRPKKNEEMGLFLAYSVSDMIVFLHEDISLELTGQAL